VPVPPQQPASAAVYQILILPTVALFRIELFQAASEARHREFSIVTTARPVLRYRSRAPKAHLKGQTSRHAFLLVAALTFSAVPRDPSQFQ